MVWKLTGNVEIIFLGLLVMLILRLVGLVNKGLKKRLWLEVSRWRRVLSIVPTFCDVASDTRLPWSRSEGESLSSLTCWICLVLSLDAFGIVVPTHLEKDAQYLASRVRNIRPVSERSCFSYCFSLHYIWICIGGSKLAAAAPWVAQYRDRNLLDAVHWIIERPPTSIISYNCPMRILHYR